MANPLSIFQTQTQPYLQQPPLLPNASFNAARNNLPLAAAFPKARLASPFIMSSPSSHDRFINPALMPQQSLLSPAKSLPEVTLPATALASSTAGKPKRGILKTAWQGFVLLAPILGFVGGSAWMAKGLPGGVKTAVVNPLAKALGRPTVSAQSIDRVLEQIGQKAIGLNVLTRSINGISSGLLSAQPSMILGNIVQVIPAGILAFKESSRLKNLAMNMNILFGGLFTMGLANEIRNKNQAKSPNEIRRYNMSTIKALFSMDSKLTIIQRLTGTGHELSNMATFTLQDHVVMIKNLAKDVKRLIRNDSSRNATGQPQSKRIDAFKGWLQNSSADKSQLSVLLFYFSSLPPLILARHLPKLTEHPAIVAFSGLGMLLANLSMFTMASKRDDWQGKAPLLGAPLAVLGTAFRGKGDFFRGMSQSGDGLSEFFMSDLAVNGLRTSNRQ